MSEILSKNRNRILAIIPFETSDLSQFKDPLEAAAIMYRLDPIFLSDVYLTSDVSEAEKQRKQRDAVRVINSSKNILKESEENPRYALIVTTEDCFSSKSSHVFGLANRDLGVGLVSTARLTEWNEDLTPSQIKERILKEAAHEIGHLGGLTHCQDQTCVMAFVDTIEKLDEKLPLLCLECQKKLRTTGR
ncbi:MAG: hypothetical protein ACYCQJ_13950 [Nitrososphaerales archaeon]